MAIYVSKMNIEKKLGKFLMPLSLITILNIPTKKPEQNKIKNRKSNFVKFGYFFFLKLRAFLFNKIKKNEIKTNSTPKLTPKILKCLNP